MEKKIKHLLSLPNVVPATIIAGLIGFILLLVVPLLEHIGPHSDEHQFFNNAWKIMAGKELHNYIHVALTEYALSIFLSIMNVVTKTGTNFPQGDPTLVSYFFGRVFGLILWLLTYLVGACILQRGEQIIRPRVIFFTVLYFGSAGLFERFMRVNSDSMSIFVAANYLLISLVFHRRCARPLHFFFINLVFVFLLSFTNFKSLYIALPIFALNTIVPLLWYEKTAPHDLRLPALYRMTMYGLGVLFGTVILWNIFIPRPHNIPNFWYSLKHTTVESVTKDYQYPALAHKSAQVYLYDLFATQLGFTQLIAITLFALVGFLYSGRKLLKLFKIRIIKQLSFENFKSGNLYASLSLILLIICIFYFVGTSSVVIHWSRWNAPLGFFFILLISPAIETIFYSLIASRFPRFLFFVMFPVLLLTSWMLLFTILMSIKMTDYPRGNGMSLSVNDFNKFLSEKGISDSDAPKKVAAFFNTPDNLKAPVVEINKLGTSGMSELDYYVWPMWGNDLLFAQKRRDVDLTIHNIREFLDQYTEGTEWRFPSPASHYIYYSKILGKNILGLTWIPEFEAMIETTYGISKMKKPNGPIKMHYEVPFKNFSHYYSPASVTFNLANLKDNYWFPPCHGAPRVLELSTGNLPPSPDPYLSAFITDMYCHSMGLSLIFKGMYRMRFIGLPPDNDENKKQMIFSAYPYEYDSRTKTISMYFDRYTNSATFGVAMKEKYVPDLKMVIDYDPLYERPTPTPTIVPVK